MPFPNGIRGASVRSLRRVPKLAPRCMSANWPGESGGRMPSRITCKRPARRNTRFLFRGFTRCPSSIAGKCVLHRNANASKALSSPIPIRSIFTGVGSSNFSPALAAGRKREAMFTASWKSMASTPKRRRCHHWRAGLRIRVYDGPQGAGGAVASPLSLFRSVFYALQVINPIRERWS